MKRIYAVLLLICLFVVRAEAQRSPEIGIRAKDASTTGTLYLEDLLGTGKINHQAPGSVTTYTLTWPTAISAGCLTANGSGTLTWQSCVSLPIDDASALIKGSADATKLFRFEVDGLTTATTRVATAPDANFTMAGINISQTFSADQTFTANLLFSPTNTRSVGTDLLRPAVVYGFGGDFAPGGASGSYVKSRKFELADLTGFSPSVFWDMIANIALTQSIFTIRENAGGTVVQFQKQLPIGGVVNDAIWSFDQHPDTDGGRSLGEPGRRWDANLRNITVASCTGCGTGITNLNGLTAATQTFAFSGSGTDFQIVSSGSTHNFNLPSASQFARGLVTTSTQSFAGDKTWYGSQLPGAGRTYSHGNSTYPWYNITATRIEIADPFTSPGIWRIQATAASSNTLSFVDGSGGTPLQLIRSSFLTSNKAYFDLDVEPVPFTSRNLGTPSNRWNNLSTNIIEMPSSGNATVFVGSGNFYNRHFAGSPSCAGVANGWTGIDTFNLRIWVCIAGVARYATLF